MIIKVSMVDKAISKTEKESVVDLGIDVASVFSFH